MNLNQRPDEETRVRDDDDDRITHTAHDGLDNALQLAFGAGASQSPHGGLGVLRRLDESLGGAARVLLRDAADESESILRPAPRSPQSAARYQVLGEIARGGVGVVMRSRDTDLGRDVAMKLLRPDHRGNAAMVRRFVEEAQIAGQLQHPGILPVYELGLLHGNEPYFTMKLVKGKTLGALLNERSAPEAERGRFIGIFEQVCQTVGYAHAKGVIHRDLKPSNIMVGSFGEVSLVDWGLAKVLSHGGLADEGDDPESIIATVRSAAGDESATGSVMGTPAYMAPEQARGDVARLDERTDVFALGALLCEILTGAPPYRGDRSATLRAAAEPRLEDAVARLTSCGADAELIRLAQRCLAPTPSERPPNAGLVADAVSQYRAALESRARAAQVAAAETAVRIEQERRARRLSLALAAVVVAFVAISAVAWNWRQRELDARSASQARAVDDALARAIDLFAVARSGQVGEERQWSDAIAAAENLSSLLYGEMPAEARERGEAFLERFRAANADRRLVERIEQIVIMGATHEDKDSWLWMEEQLRRTFLDHGIDLDKMSYDEVTARIRASDVSGKLVDGLELWIGTIGHLYGYGVTVRPMNELMAWLKVLYAADPDPFATKLRQLLYSPKPAREEVLALVRSVDLSTLRPRTIAWMASVLFRVGETQELADVMRRGVMLYPHDFMLNFDMAYHLQPLKQWQQVARYYMRCLAIRPNSAGVWRSLGNALRNTGEHREAFDAFEQSLKLQPDHAWTFADYALTLLEGGELARAVETAERAVALKPDMAIAHGHLGRALQGQGKLAAALNHLERCHALGQTQPGWTAPSEQWLAECRALIESTGGARSQPAQIESP